MPRSIWSYLGFTSFILIVFLNAFTDLGHKIIIQNTLFKHYTEHELRIYTAVIQAMILLPFVMTFTPAGFLSDKFPKQRIIQIAAFIAIPITLAITVCYYMGWFWAAFWMTFILGLQSAIYSPAKYAYIRELVGKDHIAQANSAVQAVTIVAILGGMIAYTVLFEYWFSAHAQSLGEILQSIKYVGFFLVAGTAVEFYLSLSLPQKQEVDEQLRFDWPNYMRFNTLKQNLNAAWSNQTIWLSIIGLSIFFAINQVIVANFSAHLKEFTGETNTMVANGIMAMAGIGIVLGSLFAGKVSRNYIETGIIPLGALGMCVALLFLPWLKNYGLLALVCTIFGFFGGLFIVPLNSLIQYHAKQGQSGVIVAANNFIQNWFMLGFLAFSILLAYLNISNQTVFYLLALVTFLGSLYAVAKLPQSLIRYSLGGLLQWRYKVQAVDMHHLPSTGGVLLLGNHVSWLDWAVLQIASPRPIRFVMHRLYYDRWYLRWFLDLFGVIPISGGAKHALEKVRHRLQQGEVVALFPEGHISQNGHLGAFKSGFELAAKDTGAKIVPFYLHGLWGTQFSYAASKYRRISSDKGGRSITVGFGQPLPDNVPASAVKQAVLETSLHVWRQYTQNLKPLAESFFTTAKTMQNQTALIDGSNKFSYSRLLAAVLAFQKKLRPSVAEQQNIGILLPASAGTVIANMASLALGKTVVNLNYTASLAVIESAIARADIKTILSSRQFFKKLQQHGMDLTALGESHRVLFLEDIKQGLSKGQTLSAYLQAVLLPLWWLKWRYLASVQLDDVAAILFSSGSEGIPKGVCLTHANIISNIKQSVALINPRDEDVVLSALPTFHAFGLTVTTLMPLLEGMPLVCQADPTDGKTVGRLVAQHSISILVATPTFLRLYTRNRRLHRLQFESLRIVITGAERLSDDVRQAFQQKFDKTILEGYGATETAPIASVNLPDILLSYNGDVQIGNKIGTVGLSLPGTRIKIVDPDTLAAVPTGEAGLVLISGPQVMQGYLKDPEKTAQVIVKQDKKIWYLSGDKGKLDIDGFLTIVDRYSRFAKICGEMISLTAVETAINRLINNPEIECIAVAIPDTSKGEKIVLLLAGEAAADYPNLLKNKILKSDIPPLMQPKSCHLLESLPKLGTGKMDLTAAKKWALSVAN